MKQLMPGCAATLALVFFAVGLATAQTSVTSPVADEVMKVDEAYRNAKLHNDVQVLNRVLADGFSETNQNGNSRDKAQSIDLWKSFSISSLTTDSFQVHIAGNTANVAGTQTEDGTEHMLFTRVYVNGPVGWRLLASMQFRDPNPIPATLGRQSMNGLTESERDVMKVEEAYRVAKLHADTGSLERILADAFYGTNQNGISRDKAELIDLWKSFSIRSLTTDSFKVRVTGGTAVVTGTQTENGTEHMLFTRVWVNGRNGWQLMASMQFRDPNSDRSGESRE